MRTPNILKTAYDLNLELIESAKQVQSLINIFCATKENPDLPTDLSAEVANTVTISL